MQTASGGITRRTLVRGLCALAACGALALALSAPPAQAASDIFVVIGDIEGEGSGGSYQVGSTCDVGTCNQLYSYRARVACTGCTGVPSTADLTINVSGAATDTAGCLAKRVSGEMTFSPTDPSYPPQPVFAPLSGHARDHRGFALAGTATSGAFAGYRVSVFVTLPPNPCNPGTFTGMVRFFPPEPPG